MNQTHVPTAEPVAISSFGTRAANVFSAPGELFTEVAATPSKASSWLLPMIVLIFVAALITYAFAMNDSLKHQALDPQKKEMEQKVQAGEMTEEQSDAALSMMESTTMFLTFGIIGSAVFIAIATFGAPLFLWVLSKIVLKYGGGYGKMLEVFGLSMLIGSLGAIISLLMMVLMDNIAARPGLSLFIMSDFDQKNFMHGVLASINVFSIWQTSVVGIGLAKVSNAPIGKGLGVSFALWVVYVLCSSALGFGGK